MKVFLGKCVSSLAVVAVLGCASQVSAQRVGLRRLGQAVLDQLSDSPAVRIDPKYVPKQSSPNDLIPGQRSISQNGQIRQIPNFNPQPNTGTIRLHPKYGPKDLLPNSIGGIQWGPQNGQNKKPPKQKSQSKAPPQNGKQPNGQQNGPSPKGNQQGQAGGNQNGWQNPPWTQPSYWRSWRRGTTRSYPRLIDPVGPTSFELPKFGFSSILVPGRAMRVTRVDRDSRAALLGLERGDMLLNLNDYRLTSDTAWEEALTDAIENHDGWVDLKVREALRGEISSRSINVYDDVSTVREKSH